jgi:anti-sigma regulatory factor (Ser/Thr protein kinase)
MPERHLLVEKRWNSHPSNVHHARRAVREVLQRCSDPTQADLIELAVGEACANAVEHGSPRGDGNEFILRCFVLTDEAQLIFEVEDEGQEFTLTDLTLSQTPDLYSENGRGLFLINQIMDSVVIHRTPVGLNVRMAKALAGVALPEPQGALS